VVAFTPDRLASRRATLTAETSVIPTVLRINRPCRAAGGSGIEQLLLGPSPAAAIRERSRSKSPDSDPSSSSVSSSSRTSPVPRTVDAANQLVELKLNRPSLSVLGVLNDENHEERADHELPGVGVAEVWTERRPQDEDDEEAKKSSADPAISELRRANLRNRSCIPLRCCTLCAAVIRGHPDQGALVRHLLVHGIMEGARPWHHRHARRTCRQSAVSACRARPADPP
jgi:hypothetical protein